jgi:hypothetical protein
MSSTSKEVSHCTVFLSLSGPAILLSSFAVSALLCPATVKRQYRAAVFTPQFATCIYRGGMSRVPVNRNIVTF